MTIPMSRWPLSFRVLAGLTLGILLGLWGGTEPWLLRFGNEDLGQLGMLVIRLLKALAIPLILFTILDAFITTRITLRNGIRLIGICLLNASVAFAIGLTLMNTFRPGLAWRGQIEHLVENLGHPAAPATPKATLDPLQNLGSYVPQSLLEPLVNNNVISVVLIALLFGAAISQLRQRQSEPEIVDLRPLEGFISAMNLVLVRVLGWVVQLVPFAVLGLVAHAVGKAGLGLFSTLSGYVGIIVAGLLLHGLVYYPLMVWRAGCLSPRKFLHLGASAVITGLSTNSSLATVPLTLKCLERMGISPASARLSACAGTNLNNDGVTLYEAMTALFLAQAVGFDLDAGQQAIVVLTSLMAGAGIAGIPEAGLIVLPLVLSAAGLPETVVAAAIPLIAPVDWLIARMRSGVNVLSDMTVAILLDAWERRYRSRES